MKNQPFRQLIANTNFLKLWASQMLSQFTIQLMSFYILTRIFARTQSTIAVSLLWIAGAIPSIIFGPFSGPLVDRFSRRQLMLVTNILQAITVACSFFVTRNIFPYYIIAFTYWFLDLLYYPSQQASAPALVPSELLPAANGLFLVTQQVSVIVGFALGGILLTAIGSTATIFIATANLALAALAVYYLPPDHKPQIKSSKNVFNFWQELQSGYEYVNSHREVSLPLLMIAASQILIAIIATSAPTYTHQILHLGLNQASFYLIIPGTLGGLTATYFIPKLQKKYRKKQFIELGALIGGVSLISLALLPPIPFIRGILTAISATGLGLCVALITIPSQSLLQQRTPAWLQGRVYGQLGFLLNLAILLPLIFAATLTDTIGITQMLLGMGLLVLVIYVFINQKGDDVLAHGFRL